MVVPSVVPFSRMRTVNTKGKQIRLSRCRVRCLCSCSSGKKSRACLWSRFGWRCSFSQGRWFFQRIVLDVLGLIGRLFGWGRLVHWFPVHNLSLAIATVSFLPSFRFLHVMHRIVYLGLDKACLLFLRKNGTLNDQRRAFAWKPV